MPAEDHVILCDGERLPGGNEELLADQVETGHELGDRVLDLDPRVHLHEEVLAVARQKAFDRPRGAVTSGSCGVDGDPSDPHSQRLVDGRRRRFLDELLVPALDRAVALPEVDHVAVAVREDLHLDVPRVDDEALDVDPRVREVLLSLARGRLERPLGLAGLPDDLHPLAPAPGGGLDDQRVADLVTEGDDVRRGRDRIDRTGNDRDARSPHGRSRSRLRAHQLDCLGGRPDPGQARPLDETRERGVLCQETVTRMYRLDARADSRLDEHVAPQVALGRGTGTHKVRLVGGAHVRAPPVRLRVHRDAPDPELAQRPEHPDRDLAPVCDEHLRERRHPTRILPEP